MAEENSNNDVASTKMISSGQPINVASSIMSPYPQIFASPLTQSLTISLEGANSPIIF